MTYKKKHSLFMGMYVVLLITITFFAVNCSRHTKTDSYPEIPLPVPAYVSSVDTLPFRFDISDQAYLKVRKNKPTEYFCDVVYPDLNAQLYCTWHKITPDKLPEMMEESRKLAFQHVLMATAINEKYYSNDFARVYGIIYDIKGEVATPLQLAITDSLTFFFNGSLYFNTTTNADSIAPVVDYIRNDIIHLMETFTSVSQ